MEKYGKTLIGYEGLYQISNLGRIKSLERKVKYQNGFRNVKEKIKKTFVGKQGYTRVELSKDGINKKNISQCITKRNKTAGGYKWITKEQFASMKYKLKE